MGAAMEIAQGLSGTHHCKAIDLIPDFIGGLIGSILLALGGAIARRRLNRLAGSAPGEP
jgi:hypothetical protein